MARCKVPLGTVSTVRGYDAQGCPVRQAVTELAPTVDNLTVADTSTVDLAVSATKELTANVIVDIDPCNNLFVTPAGLAQITREGAIRLCNKIGWEAILAAVPEDSHVIMDAGVYMKVDPTPITIKRGVLLQGKGRRATQIIEQGTQGTFKTVAPINSSTRRETTIDNLSLKSANGGMGVGFEDTCGSFVHLTNLIIQDYEHNVIWDQSEVCKIEGCIVEGTFSKTCIWLVNGANRQPGALGGFTNRITVKDCQINGDVATNLIQDDGGYSHSFIDNNYNGGRHQIRASGVFGLRIMGGEMEGSASTPIILTFLKEDGSGAGSCQGVAMMGVMCANNAATDGLIHLVSANGVSINGNFFSGGGNFTVKNTVESQGNVFAAGNHYTTPQFYDRDPYSGIMQTQNDGFIVYLPTLPAGAIPALTIRRNNVVAATLFSDGTIV